MRSRRILVSLFIGGAFALITIVPVLAIPPLPSSFYGRVQVDADNVPDGTLVRALIDGQVCAREHTQTYQGHSVYSLDVPGDDPDTPTRDGGREGDVIQFEIGGVLADQTGVWHSGTNVERDLSAESAGSLATPQATPSPVSTQTPILPSKPSPTPTTIAQPSTTPSATNQAETNPADNAGLISVLVVVVALAAGGAAWALRQRG
jgi:cell division septation protein DedD